MPFFSFSRKKKNAKASSKVAAGTARGETSSDTSGTTRGASTHVESSTTTGAAQHRTILVNEVGCTVVYEGEGPLRADIVFVHGLGGHPLETWSTRDVYWPKDLLGPRVQNIRIITFGYDANAAKVSERVSTKNLHDHARALVSDLERQRQKPEEVARPIIFMAHSLGGIVVKDGLEFSKQEAQFKPELASIYLATYGVVFFGTPHQGSTMARLGVIAATAFRAVGKETNTSLLRSLETSSENLTRTSEAFAKLLANREIKVHSFLEEHSITSIAGVGKVVEDSSGRLNDAFERVDHLPADHLEMVRFKDDSESGGFQKVLTAILRFVAGATEDVANGKLPKKLPANGV